MSKILDIIRARFFRYGDILSFGRNVAINGFETCHYKFSTLIWYNICDLLTDLIEDVVITDDTNAPAFSEESNKFLAFKSFVYAWGKFILQSLFDNGFVVIAYDKALDRFFILESSDYIQETADGVTIVKPKDENLQVFVMKSATFMMYGKSDKAICGGFLNFLDDTLNGSATVSKRLGAVVVASPKNLNAAPTATVLTDEQKKKLEKDIREEYGALDKQSNIMLLPREMSMQTINLAGLDLRMVEKVKTAILAIVDRIKVPANQVAIIDAQSNKALANGGELREGDRQKYKSFKRLFERTFADMARFYGLRISYSVAGEPVDEAVV